jgi:nucleoside-diphosphate-sugar epimerase
MYDNHDKPILITGGSGFIASYLAMKLLEAGEQVVLFDRDPDLRRLIGFNAGPSDPLDPKYDPKDRYNNVRDRVTFVQGDVSILAHVLALFAKHEPKSVFHLGALLSAGADGNPTMGFEVDLVGSRNVFEAARIFCQQNNAPPVRVLFPSTIASFGLFITGGQEVPNEAVQMPTTMYGVAKVATERLGEYYTSKGWIDFRAVRFPSVIGAARGPGGTTVYSTLMIQAPMQNKAYEAYVPKETRLDILYIRDAVDALLGLHAVDPAKLKASKRRVYNIAGIRLNGLAPQALEIEAAAKKVRPEALIGYKTNQTLTDTVNSFGILNDKAARDDWGWKGAAFSLDQAVADFKVEVEKYPNRIKAIELY